MLFLGVFLEPRDADLGSLLGVSLGSWVGRLPAAGKRRKNRTPLQRQARFAKKVSSCKYQFLKSFEEDNCLVVYGKKTRGGCCLMATNQAVIIATFDEGAGHAGAACNAAVAELAKYLHTKGY